MNKTPKTVEIYALCDPDTGAVRYVGKANDAKVRFRQHLWPAARKRAPLALWVRKLRADGRRPTMKVLERTSAWEERERYWIAHFRAAKVPLLNVSAGGLDLAYLRPINGRAPAYRWAMIFCAKTGSSKLARMLRNAAAAAKAVGQTAAFDDDLRSTILGAIPLARIPARLSPA